LSKWWVDASWLDFLPTNEKSHKITFAQKTHELWELYCPELQEIPRQSLSLPSRYTLPEEDKSIIPNLDIEGIEKKEGKRQTELKLLTENHLKKSYPLEEWVHVFTDGSQDNGSNSGYGLHCIFFEESHAMEPGLSTFDAEVKAIVWAVERIAETANITWGEPNLSSCRTARRPSSPSSKRKTAMSWACPSKKIQSG
jgi:hypothetical protein